MKKFLVHFFCLFFLFLYPWHDLRADSLWQASVEGGFSVSVELSDTTMTTLDMLSVTITFTYPADYEIDVNRVRAKLLQYAGMVEPPFSFVSERIEELGPGKKRVIFFIKPQLEGFFFLSLYDILFSPKDSQQQSVTILSDIFQVEVSSPPEKKSEHPELYPLLSLSKQFPVSITQENRRALLENAEFFSEQQREIQRQLKQKTLPWKQIAATVLCFVLILILRLQPKRERTEKEKKTRASTFKEVRSKIDDLEERFLIKEGHTDTYYIEICKVMRIYLQNAYGISASAQTTTELMDSLKKFPEITAAQKRLFGSILDTSDGVKFAKETPSLDESLKVSRFIKEIF